jgi:hypothetical protein
MAYSNQRKKTGEELLDHGCGPRGKMTANSFWCQDKSYDMLYGGGGKNNGGSMQTRGGSGGMAGVELVVGTQEGNYICESGKQYRDKFSIEQEFDNGTAGSSNELYTMSSFDKDVGQVTAHSASVIVIKNTSSIAAEIQLKLKDWKDDSDTDARNLATDLDSSGTSDSRFISFLLPAGNFIYLPTSRFLSYTPVNVADGGVNSAAFAADGANSFLPSGVSVAVAGTTLVDGSELDTVVNPETFTVDTGGVDNSSMFKVDDLLLVDSEVMRVTAITGNTLTVDRGLFGSTIAAHTDNTAISFWFGNESLVHNSSLCTTDQNGYFKQSGAFFGKARTTDKVGDGLVPGSVALGPFYSKGGYLDFGLQNIKSSDETGLAASTTYTFHVVIDQYHANGADGVDGETAIAFTTDASDTTFNNSGNAVLPKIQERFDALFYDASSGLHNKKVTINLVKGDIRITSHSNNVNTRVGIANISGTTPFGVGRFPAKDGNNVPVVEGTLTGTTSDNTDCISYGPASSTPLEEIEDPVTNKTIPNSAAFILDDGNGNLMYNNAPVGRINYEKGHCEFSFLPNAQFSVHGQSHSAHSGGVSYVGTGYNSIQTIYARSVNEKMKTKLNLLLLG